MRLYVQIDCEVENSKEQNEELSAHICPPYPLLALPHLFCAPE